MPRATRRPPNRRTHDAVAEVRHLTSHSYEWVVEGDIKACFDEISHPALMGRVRDHVGDKRVLSLVKAFLKAGILGEDRVLRENNTGTPKGRFYPRCSATWPSRCWTSTSPTLPGDPGAETTERAKRRRRGLPNTGWSGSPIYAERGISPLMPSTGLCRPWR